MSGQDSGVDRARREASPLERAALDRWLEGKGYWRHGRWTARRVSRWGSPPLRYWFLSPADGYEPGIPVVELPDGQLLGPGDAVALPALLQHVTANDAFDDLIGVARVAADLGHWPQPVGNLIHDRMPPTPKPIDTLPTGTLDPRLIEVAGHRSLLFYTFEPELLDLFACELELSPSLGRVRCRKLTQAPRSRPSPVTPTPTT